MNQLPQQLYLEIGNNANNSYIYTMSDTSVNNRVIGRNWYIVDTNNNLIKYKELFNKY